VYDGGRNNQPFGFGTVDVALTQRGEIAADRPATSAQATTALTYLEANAPVALLKQFRGLTATPDPVVVVCTYNVVEGTPESQQCDWDAEANKKDVSAETPGSNLIEVAVAWGADVIEAGDRVLIAGKEATVALEPGNASAPVSGSMSKFTTTTWPWTGTNLVTGGPLGGAFAICASGGLIMDVYSAIEAYLNGIDGDIPDGRGSLPKIGPARCAYAAPMPDWDDTFRIDFIKSAAALAGGGYIQEFKTVTIDAAAVDYDPTYDATANVVLVTCPEIELYQEAL
jgi:hypothetical protein